MSQIVFPPKAVLEAEVTRITKLLAFKHHQRRIADPRRLLDQVESRWREFRDMAIDFIAMRYAVEELQSEKQSGGFHSPARFPTPDAASSPGGFERPGPVRF